MSERMHITWSIGTPNGECPMCGERTVMVVSSQLWDVDSESADKAGYDPDAFVDGITVDEELTGHFCPTCRVLTSLSFNR